MATIESTAQRFVLTAGGTTLVLDKEAGAASLQRKALFWDRKPAVIPLADICKVAVTPAFERSCGFATSYTLLVARSGHHLELPPAAKASAEEAADAIRAFLGLDEKT
ncbi:MAG: hypothetical protein U1E81_18970 [Xanthobacteraceae bacterium]